MVITPRTAALRITAILHHRSSSATITKTANAAPWLLHSKVLAPSNGKPGPFTRYLIGIDHGHQRHESPEGDLGCQPGPTASVSSKEDCSTHCRGWSDSI